MDLSTNEYSVALGVACPCVDSSRPVVCDSFVVVLPSCVQTRNGSSHPFSHTSFLQDEICRYLLCTSPISHHGRNLGGSDRQGHSAGKGLDERIRSQHGHVCSARQ